MNLLLEDIGSRTQSSLRELRKTDRASGAEMSFFVLRPAVKMEKTSGRRCKYHLSALNAQFGTLNVAFSKKEI